MRELAKITIFSLLVIGGFAGYTRFGLPLIVPEPPPVEEKLTGDITMEQYIAFGKKIFHGKGTCTLCHNDLGRAPMLDSVAQHAPDRLKDERYKGEATTIQEYIHESMIKPSAFVVAGFGKKGTNDTVSPMPDVSKGAIGLNEVEINAIIAYFQSSGGVDVTVELPTGEAPVAEEEPQEIKVAENAQEALEKFECGTCHMHPLIEDGGDIGPDLGPLAKIGAQRIKGMTGEQYIVESIMNPNAFIVEDFDEDTMPEDFPERITYAELDMIVKALLGQSEESKE